ncbi:MAG: metal ABC transporter permease [candidate division Zixibacteria bacterium]|nr:metal ABC transporter permease [Candidatus Tariuqbacter arcticus]
MTDFFAALQHSPFIQNAILTGILVSVACGMVGSYVVTRRISYIAGSIAHFVLGGMGLVRYLNVVHGWEKIEPFHGAVVSALIAALIIGFVSLRMKEREDTVIGALWAVGMAVGIIFISKTPGYNTDLMSYLFGNILMVSSKDLWLILGLDILVVGIGLAFYKQLLAVCFDEEYARLRGINVEFYYLILLCLTALTVVLLVTIVGIVMVIALLTLPAGIASVLSRRLWMIMILATIFSVFFTSTGIALSYEPNLPAGAVIIIIAGLVYIIVLIGKKLVRLK